MPNIQTNWTGTNEKSPKNCCKVFVHNLCIFNEYITFCKIYTALLYHSCFLFYNRNYGSESNHREISLKYWRTYTQEQYWYMLRQYLQQYFKAMNALRYDVPAMRVRFGLGRFSGMDNNYYHVILILIFTGRKKRFEKFSQIIL